MNTPASRTCVTCAGKGRIQLKQGEEAVPCPHCGDPVPNREHQKQIDAHEARDRPKDLRDEFAMAALPAMIGALATMSETQKVIHTKAEQVKGVAVGCYEIADAMMKARAE